MDDLKILILLCAANGAPILLDNVLGEWCACPVDGGVRLNDGHRLLGPSKTWRGLAASFTYLPPGGTVRPAIGGNLLRAAAAIWQVGVEIAAPVVAATLLCDVALGFFGKASPQMPVVFVGLSAKSLLGLTVLAGSLAFWPGLWEHQFTVALGISARLLHLAR